jgi:hypothetical protein
MNRNRCEAPLSYERFVDYWFGDLTPAEQDALERHLLDCKLCGARAETWALDTAALAGGARLLPRGFVSPEELAALGHRAVLVDLPPGPEFTLRLKAGAIFVFRVAVDPTLARELERLDVEYLKEGYPEPIFQVDSLPIPASGGVYLACHGDIMNAHGDSTMRLIGTRGGRRFTVFETLVHFV